MLVALIERKLTLHRYIIIIVIIIIIIIIIIKALTLLIRDRIYSFLVSKNYIESDIQKGFVPGMSGIYEHIANLSYPINHPRKKQKSLTIT